MVQIESIVLSYKHIVFIYTHTHTYQGQLQSCLFFFDEKKGHY